MNKQIAALLVAGEITIKQAVTMARRNNMRRGK